MADRNPAAEGVNYFKGVKRHAEQPLRDEIDQKKEYGRTEVLQAVQEGYTSFENAIRQKLIDDGHEPIFAKLQGGGGLTPAEITYLANLSPNEKRVLTEYVATAHGKRVSLDANKDTIELSYLDSGGKTVTITEGMPVEGILNHLRREIDQIKRDVKAGTLAADEAQRRLNEIQKRGYILYKSSKVPKLRIKHGTNVLRGTPERDRLDAEVGFISSDWRSSQNPDAGAQAYENFARAIQILDARRELVLPADEAEEEIPITVLTPPDPPEDPAVVAARLAGTTPPTLTPGEAENGTGEAASAPQPPRIEDIMYEAGIIDRSADVRKRARDEAVQQLQDEQRQYKWWNVRDWFRRNMESHKREKYSKWLVEAKLRNNNAFASLDIVNKGAATANERGQNKRVEEQTEARAKLEQMRTMQRAGMVEIGGERVAKAGAELKNLMVAEIIRPMVNQLRDGNPVEPGQQQQMIREFLQRHIGDENNAIGGELRRLFGADATGHGEAADYFATDFENIARRMVTDMETHGFALQQLEGRIDIILGNAQWAAQTEEESGFVKKAVDWVQKRRSSGYSLNPASSSALITVAGYGALRGIEGFFRGTARAAEWVLPGGGAMFGGTLAALRRCVDLRRDRAMHARERAYGREIPTERDGKGRERQVRGRAEMEGMIYDQASVQELINGGGKDQLLNNGEEVTRESLQSLVTLVRGTGNTEDNRKKLMSRVLEIKARLDVSSREKIDLIRFDGEFATERGRLELVKAIAEGQQALRASGMTDVSFEIMQAALQGGEDGKTWYDVFKLEQKQKDKAFEWFKAKKATATFVRGSLLGGAAGLALQEAVALGLRGVGQRVSATAIERAIGWAGDRAEDAVDALPADMQRFVDGASVAMGFDAFIDAVDTVIANSNANSIVDILPEANVHIGPDPTGQFKAAFIDNSTGRVIGDASVLTELNPPGTPPGSFIFHDELPTEIKDAAVRMGFTIEPGPMTTIMDRLPVGAPVRVDLNGHMTNIPAGTEWVPAGVDAAGNTQWDLVVSADKDVVLIDDMRFQPDGTMQFEHAHSMIRPTDIVTTEEVSGTRTEIIDTSVDVLGPTGEWARLATPIRTMEYYSYNEAGSQLNELKLYTFKKDDNIILSMHSMLDGYQDGLTPNPIHIPGEYAVPEEVRRTAFSFSMPGEIRSPILVQTDAQGFLSLNVNDNDPTSVVKIFNPDTGQFDIEMQRGVFSQMVVNQDQVDALSLQDGNIGTEYNGVYRNPDFFNIWRVGGDLPNNDFGHISAGTVQFDAASGETDWQSSATIRGMGQTPDYIPGNEVRTIEDTRTVLNFDYDGEYPTDQETTLVKPPDDIDVPIIPLPFERRKVMERMKEKPTPGLSPIEAAYYGGESLGDLQRWMSENPNRLQTYTKSIGPDGKTIWLDKEGKPVSRDIEREKGTLRTYLEDVRAKDPGYYAELERLVREITIKPMKKETRVAVNIPAWMEEKNIYRVLSEYVKQTDKKGQPLNPDLFEINIIVNRKRGATSDKTVDEINRFISDIRAQGKDFTINFVDVEFDPPYNNVGNARRVITDLTLLRSIQRPMQDGSLYIESEDADLLNVDPRTVINLIEKLDNEPYIDAVAGVQDREPGYLMQNDFLFVRRRVEDFLVTMLRKNRFKPENNSNWNNTWHRVVTGGWNAGYSAEAIALIGGYDQNRVMGEDLIIGELMTMIRGDGTNPNLDVVRRIPSRSDSSPRRFISEIVTGRAAYSDAFADEELNRMIRNETIDQLLSRIDSLSRINNTNRAEFDKMIGGFYEYSKQLTPSVEEADKLFASVMFYLGFKKTDYRIDNGTLVILSYDNLAKALEDYRTRNASNKPAPTL